MGEVLRIILAAVLAELWPRTDAPTPDDRPSELALQNNLDRGAEYRKEYYKYTIGIATAMLAFTVSFPPQLTRQPLAPWLMFVGWFGLGVAVLAGVRVHMVWAKFFVTFRDYDDRRRRAEGQRVRDGLNAQRRFLDVAQMIGLAVGVSCVVIFTGLNMRYVALKKDEVDTKSAAKLAVEAPPKQVANEDAARPVQAEAPAKAQPGPEPSTSRPTPPKPEEVR